MTSGIAEQLDCEESMAHVKDRKGNSPENIKANEDEFVQAEREETSLETHVNNDRAYTEHNNDREEFEAMDPCAANDPHSMTLRIKPEKINNEAVEESNKSMRISNIDAFEEYDNEIERGEDDNRDDSEAAIAEVINTHTVQ